MPETVVRFDDRRPIPAAVFIGNENDNLVERVAFELADWLSEAVVYIYLTANGKSDVVNIGTGRVFDITRTHTHEAGRWEAYLEAYLNGDRVWHSDEFAMYVGALPTIGEQIAHQYPTAIEDALKAAETLTGMGAKIEMLPEGSEPTVRTEEVDGRLVLVFGIPAGGGSGAGQNGATFIPHVSEDGTVYWTNDGGLSNPTPVNIMGPAGPQGETGPAGADGAAGADGFSPTITATAIDGGHQLTITDANGIKTINVWDGKDGTGDGTGGGSGADGFSPTITTDKITGGNRLTITDVNGTKTVDIMDGKDGGTAEVDATLTQEGMAADAAAVGGAVERLSKNGAWETRRPFVSFVADDGYPEDITVLAPIFDKYAAPCCVALISTSINNLQERLDLQNNNGWEVACHSTSSTPFTQMPIEQVEAAMVEAKEALENLGFVVRDVVYPSGACNYAIKQVAKRHFRAGYEFNPHPSLHLNTGILDSFSILRVPLGSFTYAAENATLDYYKACVDAAISKNGWVIFCLHSGAAEFDETQRQHLDDLLAYIRGRGIEIGNLSDGYEIFGNYIECGPTFDVSTPKNDKDLSGFKVANSGEHNLPIQLLKGLTHTSADLITAYPMDKLSVVETGHYNAGFPLNCGGTLITSRFENFGFQVWFPYLENQIFRRTWHSGAWRAWQKVSAEPTSDSQISRLWQLSGSWSDNVAITISKRLFVRTFHINGGTSATLTKQFFNLADISTNKDAPTVIGTTSDGAEIHMAYQTNGHLLFKTSDTTSRTAYVEIAYA